MDSMDKPGKEDPAEQPASEPAQAGDKPAPRNAVTKLYDKIPLTYRQVDLLVKILIAALVVLLVIAVATGSGIQA